MAANQSEEWKGYVYALVGTIAFSSLYVFSKAGLNQVELAQFGLYYFGIGFLLNLIFILATGKFRQLPGIPKKVIGCLLYTSDAADEEDSVDLGGRRIIKKKKNK